MSFLFSFLLWQRFFLVWYQDLFYRSRLSIDRQNSHCNFLMKTPASAAARIKPQHTGIRIFLCQIFMRMSKDYNIDVRQVFRYILLDMCQMDPARFDLKPQADWQNPLRPLFVVISHYNVKRRDRTELVDQILEKAKLRKGLSHREASVLLACEDEKKNAEIYDLAEQIKKDFYGTRIVMFAPLYLSNYCVNGCLYCPYHAINKTIPRKKLTQEEVRQEVIALQDMGHKRLAIESGEDPINNPIEYILECIKTIYSVKHKNGAIRRVNVNIAATTVENYRKLKEAGIGTYILFQETYHKDSYEVLHPTGPKHNYA